MGRLWQFGDDIDTDAIIPGRFLVDWGKNPQKLRDHCFIDMLPQFAAQVQSGDYIIGGANFGCGSSREGAPVAIKLCGIDAIIAKSFARIFYRNCINIGLLALEAPVAAERIRPDDRIAVDIGQGIISNDSRNETYPFQPVPPFLKDILAAGGLTPYVMQRLSLS